MECKLEENKKLCTCTYEPCPRKGKCCECVQYHLNSGEFPGCFFSEKDEASYDRSIARFVRSYQGRK